MTTRSKKIVILLTPEERKRLDAEARRRKVSRSHVVREALSRVKGARA